MDPRPYHNYEQDNRVPPQSMPMPMPMPMPMSYAPPRYDEVVPNPPGVNNQRPPFVQAPMQHVVFMSGSSGQPQQQTPYYPAPIYTTPTPESQGSKSSGVIFCIFFIFMFMFVLYFMIRVGTRMR